MRLIERYRNITKLGDICAHIDRICCKFKSGWSPIGSTSYARNSQGVCESKMDNFPSSILRQIANKLLAVLHLIAVEFNPDLLT